MKIVFLLSTFLILLFLKTQGLAHTPFYQQQIKDTLPDNFKKRGFTNITQGIIGFEVGRTAYRKNRNSAGLQTINGFQFNPNTYLGLGVGIDIFKDNVIFPVFIDLRTFFSSGRVTPLAALNLGYSLGGGPFVNIESGIKCFVSRNTALNFTAAYRIQKFARGSINTINLKIGASF